MEKSNIIEEVYKWSDLPDLISNYEKSIGSDGVVRVFGYASVIDNHADIKTGSKLPNEENVFVDGMQVAMNVFAVGPAEFRGTNDRANGVYNVGLYAGLEDSTEETAKAYGINVTLAKENMQAGISAFISRELGNPPNGLKIEDLFNPEKKADFSALKGTDKDEFGLYKFQVIETTTEQGKFPAFAVSTNEKSKFSAIGLTPHEAAWYILDGQGYSRPSGNGETMLGGAAADYFLKNVVEAYEKRGYIQPKIEATRDAVLELAEFVSKFQQISASEHLPEKDKQDRLVDLHKTHVVDRGINLSTRVFADGEAVVSRDEVSAEHKAGSNMPKTSDEKFSRVEALLNEGKLNSLQR